METVTRIENENRKRHVLVVDDEIINRMILGNILQSEFDVFYASDGEEAWAFIQREYDHLSIILLDLLMPKIDGFELLKRLNGSKKYKSIPVIVLTSEKDAEIKSLQMGAVDFIPKPYEMPEVICARVKRSIKLAEENSLLNAVKNDSLTKLYNKEFFYQYALDQDRFHADQEMDMLVLNVNRFHIVNELYGHKTGDDLLRGIAESLRFFLRKNSGLACRCYSDTFYVYIAHRSDYDTLFPRFLAEVEKNSGLKDISIRIGVYENCDKQLTLDQRIDRAARACSSCRKTYKSSIAMFDNAQIEKDLLGEKLIHESERALREKQFQVHYQPKFNIEGEVPVFSSAEALIRWNHPEFGRISPGVFIPLFEENGLIQKLDNYVWNEAARQVNQWKKELGVRLPVSVNVSRVDMFDPKLEEELLGIIERNELSPDELLLEITESAYSDNSSALIEIVNKLRSDGFRIEMDDFGSGYSSLNMLSSMPIDILKLDMGFIRKMCDNEKNKQMVEIMMEIAKVLDVPVIAEGVETAEQYGALKDMGCNVIQGYYFSKPLPPEELEEMLLTRTAPASRINL
ncbi:MAG: EAL domain-containing protein [Clostridia bacterium]|nr:EAL domain-containing protein [Clostridia bacterium]